MLSEPVTLLHSIVLCYLAVQINQQQAHVPDTCATKSWLLKLIESDLGIKPLRKAPSQAGKCILVS